MTERNPSGGAMTGATGGLTPDELAEPFIPAERREVSDPQAQAAVTAAQAARAPAQAGDVGDPGSDRPDAGPTNLASRESGYGSEHGLSPNDPAYRMESRPVATPDESTPPRDGHTRIGGDNVSDEDHF
ncbi:MAG: hypothetical protein M3406_11840 [Chloroflexota bacterium]|nr:hypothetical protein [Chloroflexota bacterium]